MIPSSLGPVHRSWPRRSPFEEGPLLLHDILEAIQRILAYVPATEAEFRDDKLKQDAILRNLEVIGEATKGLSKDIRSRYGTIPWRRISGMRDRLIHDYAQVRLDLVWTVVRDELPRLRDVAQEALDAESKN